MAAPEWWWNEMQPSAIGHIATESSTLDWIMQGLLERVGLQITSAEEARPGFMAYFCRKPSNRRLVRVPVVHRARWRICV